MIRYAKLLYIFSGIHADELFFGHYSSEEVSIILSDVMEVVGASNSNRSRQGEGVERMEILDNICTKLLSNEPRQANLCLRAFRHDKF